MPEAWIKALSFQAFGPNASISSEHKGGYIYTYSFLQVAFFSLPIRAVALKLKKNMEARVAVASKVQRSLSLLVERRGVRKASAARPFVAWHP